MTEIRKLLSEDLDQKYEIFMFGEDENSGIHAALPAWLNLNSIGEECVCCLLLLSEKMNLAACDKNSLYDAYVYMMERIVNNHNDMEFDGNILNRKPFMKFIKAYPQLLKI